MPETLGSAGMVGPAISPPEHLLPPVSVYPERHDPKHHWLDPVEATVLHAVNRLSGPFRWIRLRRLARRADLLSGHFADLSDKALAEETSKIRQSLRRHGMSDRTTPLAFAIIREHATRTLGLRHHRVQLLGGAAMLDGALAEMETGEGKTLTATLAAGTAAMAGIPVHIVTVNDYLAGRDAETMTPLYARLGLTVATVIHGLDPDARRRAYMADITYASNKEIAFDYLRDRVRLGGPPRNIHMKLERMTSDDRGGLVMRGLHFAIVDEADSVLVDEARTPLILSRETDASAERVWAEQAHALADQLTEGRHFKRIRDERRIQLNTAGKRHLEDLGLRIGGIWENRIRREQAARQALTAKLMFHRGDQYLVKDGKVVIVDEYTGRVMEERSWSDGLHQLVEVKEGVEVTSRKETMARMTYQRFFRRYRRLAGMTGTASEVSGELWAVYKLRVVKIPTNAPVRRTALPMRIFRTEEEKWREIADRARTLSDNGRAVVIGTRSVVASEAMSECLTAQGIPHEVLNANEDAREAEVISLAGLPGRVTVATNMAGRGVDIALGDGVEAAGGLHVILSERHDSRRIDRQLEGRTARRGEPGSTEAMLSLEDPILDLIQGSVLSRSASVGPLRGLLAHALFRRAQSRAESAHSKARKMLLDQDRRLGTILAFSGVQE
ncbi:MAG: prepilin peptidase [Pseudomonadota bacterium]